MAQRNYSANAVERSLGAAVNSTATTVQIASGGGFPAPPFTIAVDAGTESQEVMLVTAVSGTTYSVTRGYDGTAAVPHGTGATVHHVHTALDFREANNHIQADTGVHGVGSGEVVGTTKAQTLSNKTLDLGSNTVTGTVAQFNQAVSDGDFATTAQLTTTNNSITALGNRVTAAETDIDNLEKLTFSSSSWLTAAEGWTVTSTEWYTSGPVMYVSATVTKVGTVSEGITTLGTINPPAGYAVAGGATRFVGMLTDFSKPHLVQLGMSGATPTLMVRHSGIDSLVVLRGLLIIPLVKA